MAVNVPCFEDHLPLVFGGDLGDSQIWVIENHEIAAGDHHVFVGGYTEDDLMTQATGRRAFIARQKLPSLANTSPQLVWYKTFKDTAFINL